MSGEPNEIEYSYESNPENNLSPEELAELAAQQQLELNAEEEERRKRHANALRRHMTAKRIGRALGKSNTMKSRIARAKATVSDRKKAEVRNKAIRNLSRKARSNYKRDVINAVNAAYGTNNALNAEVASLYQAAEHGEIGEEEMMNAIANIQVRKNSKPAVRQEIVDTILRSLHNSALARNAALYGEAKIGYNLESVKYRPHVLRIAALDDLMAEKKKQLAVANTNEKAEAAAAKYYNANILKEEIDFARHTNKAITREQEARFAALIADEDFTSMNTSLYRRLRNYNAIQSAREKAATTIQRMTRGRQGRKAARIAKALRNQSRRAEAESAAAAAQGKALQMVNVASLAAERPAAPAPLTEAERAQRRALMAARFAKKGGKRCWTRKRKN